MLISKLRGISMTLHSRCNRSDRFFSPSRWLGEGASRKQNFEAVVGRSYAMQLVCGKKKQLLQEGQGIMVESGLTVCIGEKELELLKNSIENVPGPDDRELFFVFLRAKSKYSGFTEVTKVLPLCDGVGKGLRILVENVRRRKVRGRTVPAYHTFSYTGNEGLTFDYDKYQNVKSGRHGNGQ